MAEQPPRPPDGDAPPGAEPGDPPTPPFGAPAGWGASEYQLPAPPADDPTGYVRANAGRYTREALTARLAAAGHPADAIAAAWATVEAEDAAEGRRDRRGTVSKVVGAAYVATWLVLTLLWLASNSGQVGSIALVSGVFAFFLLVPGILGYVLPRRSRRLQRAGIGTAVAFALVPLLILVALAGMCVSIVPPGGFG
jgi:hypothetical protein